MNERDALHKERIRNDNLKQENDSLRDELNSLRRKVSISSRSSDDSKDDDSKYIDGYRNWLWYVHRV